MKQRLAYIDGLRAVAVLMVVFQHAAVFWSYQPTGVMARRAGDIYWWFTGQWHEGVCLFLVLSGFCLSYPAWQRRKEGIKPWFSVKTFAWRRCRRILPPYYAALVLCLLLDSMLATRHDHLLPVLGASDTVPNVLAHVLLIHNMTPFIASINAPFWSLALEWQWYFVFPPLLVLYARFPRTTIGLTTLLVIVWHFRANDLWPAYQGTSAAMPACLFQFMMGVGAAKIAVERPNVRKGVLIVGCLLPLAMVSLPHVESLVNRTLGQTQPIWALAFASLILLASSTPTVERVFSFRPLVLVGVWSYSIYLVHVPVIRLVGTFGPGMSQWWLFYVVCAPVLGIMAGLAFYWSVERHFTGKRVSVPAWRHRNGAVVAQGLHA